VNTNLRVSIVRLSVARELNSLLNPFDTLEILAAAVLKIIVFSEVTPCSLVYMYEGESVNRSHMEVKQL
jgi:hypothetical protein